MLTMLQKLQKRYKNNNKNGQKKGLEFSSPFLLNLEKGSKNIAF